MQPQQLEAFFSPQNQLLIRITMLLMTANEVETLEKQIENPRHETALCLFWVFFPFIFQ